MRKKGSRKRWSVLLIAAVLITSWPMTAYAEEIPDDKTLLTEESAAEANTEAYIEAVTESNTAAAEAASEDAEPLSEEEIVVLPDRLPLHEALETLPDTVTVEGENGTEEIAVTWECLDDYSEKDQASFVFTPVPVDGEVPEEELPLAEIYYENVCTIVGDGDNVAVSRTLSDSSLLLTALSEETEEIAFSNTVLGTSPAEDRGFWESLSLNDCHALTSAQKKVYHDLGEALDSYLYNGDPASEVEVGDKSFFCTAAISFDSSTFNNSSSNFQNGTDPNNIQSLVNSYLTSHPQYFFVTTSFLTTSSTVYINFLPDFVEPEDRSNAADKIRESMKGILKDASGTQYEKARLLHDKFCELVSYDNVAWNNNSTGRRAPQEEWVAHNILYDQSMASAFLGEHSTVCAGYSQSYTALCNAAGIPAFSIISATHAWNKVLLEQQWYNADLTWDDEGTVSPVPDTWFLKSDEDFTGRSANAKRVHTPLAYWDTLLETNPTEFSLYNAGKIVFHPGEGASLCGSTEEAQPYAYPEGQGISEETLWKRYAPVNPGNIFLGWFRDPEKTEALTCVSVEERGEINAYAKWSPEPEKTGLTITYEAEGGSFSDPSDASLYVESFETFTVLSGEKLQRPGYTLTGFSGIRPDTGKSFVYTPGKSYENDYPLKTSLRLTAIWTAKTYRITYDTAGGKCSNPSSFDAEKNRLSVLLSPEKTGYVFTGWTADLTSAQAAFTLDAASCQTVVDQELLMKCLDKAGRTELKLTAVFTPAKYSVTLDPNGGSFKKGDRYTDREGTHTITNYAEPLTEHCEYDVSYQTPIPERKEGENAYTFRGWALSPDGDVKYKKGSDEKIFFSNLADGTALYAVWAADAIPVYTASFDPGNNGKWKEDYFYTATEVMPIPEGGRDPITGFFEYDQVYSVPIPVKEGYQFQGWEDENGKLILKPSKGKVQLKNSSGKGKREFSYTAKWKKVTCRISYTMNKGKKAANSPDRFCLSENAEDPARMILPAPTRSCYQFGGWYLNASLEEPLCESMKGTKKLTDGSVQFDLTNRGLFEETPYFNGTTLQLYAKWIPMTYQVVFDTESSSDNPAVFADGETKKTYEFSYDVSYGLDTDPEVPVPEKTGYVFAGWAKGPGGTGKLYPCTTNRYGTTLTLKNLIKPTGNKSADTLTLYPRWKMRTYRINYQLDGGKKGNGSSVSFKGTPASTSYIMIADPKKKCAYFKGWCLDSACTKGLEDYLKEKKIDYSRYEGYWISINVGQLLGTKDFEKDGALTLYAKWDPYTYTISYHANEGSFVMEGTTFNIYRKDSYIYGKTYYPDSPNPEREGKTFLGWGTSPNTSRVKYKSSSKLLNLTSEDGGEVDLYAVWK